MKMQCSLLASFSLFHLFHPVRQLTSLSLLVNAWGHGKLGPLLNSLGTILIFLFLSYKNREFSENDGENRG